MDGRLDNFLNNTFCAKENMTLLYHRPRFYDNIFLHFC